MADTRRTATTITRLTQVSREIDRLEAERDQLVGAARMERHSWREIARALGVSRQAAWKAHRAAEETVRGVRDRSDLTEAQAMAIAKDALREVRTKPNHQ